MQTKSTLFKLITLIALVGFNSGLIAGEAKKDGDSQIKTPRSIDDVGPDDPNTIVNLCSSAALSKNISSPSFSQRLFNAIEKGAAPYCDHFNCYQKNPCNMHPVEYCNELTCFISKKHSHDSVQQAKDSMNFTPTQPIKNNINPEISSIKTPANSTAPAPIHHKSTLRTMLAEPVAIGGATRGLVYVAQEKGALKKIGVSKREALVAGGILNTALVFYADECDPNRNSDIISIFTKLAISGAVYLSPEIEAYLKPHVLKLLKAHAPSLHARFFAEKEKPKVSALAKDTNPSNALIGKTVPLSAIKTTTQSVSGDANPRTIRRPKPSGNPATNPVLAAQEFKQ